MDWDQIHCIFLAKLKFADWDTKERICGFATCRVIITNLRICDLRTGTPQKFAYLRLRNEPKNLLVCTQLALYGVWSSCLPKLCTATILLVLYNIFFLSFIPEYHRRLCKYCLPSLQWYPPYTHTKRQATQHDCLPILLGGGDKWIEIVYGTVRKKIFCIGPTRAATAGQKSLVPARQAQQTNQGRTHFIFIHWVPIYLSFNSQQGSPLSRISDALTLSQNIPQNTQYTK